MLKTATSLDGRFSPAGREERAPVYLTGADAQQETARLRRWCDAVLVGAGTVRSDRPRLDGRHVVPGALCPDADPLPACADGDLSDAPGWREDRHLVFTGEDAAPGRIRGLEAAGAEVVRCRRRDGRLDLHDLLDRCAERDLWAVMVEGGPTLAASFLADDLVDRWVQFVAPTALGDGVGWPQGRPDAAPPAPST